MGKRAPKKIKKPKPSQKPTIPKFVQETRETPPVEVQTSWPPKLPPQKPPKGAGNYLHGKPLYDPVYPTIKLPAALRPRYPIDWRNGGRAILCMAMAALEGIRRIWRQRQSVDWQTAAANVGFHEHIIRMDEFLNSYKGSPIQDYQSFIPPEAQAKRNTTTSVAMRWDPINCRYIFVNPSSQPNSNVPLARRISPHEYEVTVEEV